MKSLIDISLITPKWFFIFSYFSSRYLTGEVSNFKIIESYSILFISLYIENISSIEYGIVYAGRV